MGVLLYLCPKLLRLDITNIIKIMNAMSLFERLKSYKKYRDAYKNDRKEA